MSWWCHSKKLKIPIRRTVPTAKPPPICACMHRHIIVHVRTCIILEYSSTKRGDDPLPNSTSREGTPLEISSWALCSEGLVPWGWDGLLETRFLKLVAMDEKRCSESDGNFSYSTWFRVIRLVGVPTTTKVLTVLEDLGSVKRRRRDWAVFSPVSNFHDGGIAEKNHKGKHFEP